MTAAGTVGHKPFAPGRLWSLWDMLRENADVYVSLGQHIHDGRLVYRAEHLFDASKGKLTDDGVRACLEKLRLIAVAAKKLELVTSSNFFDSRVQARKAPQSLGEYDVLIDVLTTEMRTTSFLFMPPALASYYESDNLISSYVVGKFPNASEEIINSGNCLATGQFTASVFHAMRAVEIGLRALGNSAQIRIKNNKPIDTADWKDIFDGISKFQLDIENLPNNTPTKDADLLFYSEVFAQFRIFKNGWRVRVAHARATYNEAQAKECLDHVCSFFEKLATRLKESLPAGN